MVLNLLVIVYRLFIIISHVAGTQILAVIAFLKSKSKRMPTLIQDDIMTVTSNLLEC